MSSVVDFIKSHRLLCICTAGLAIVGYLGIHAICWLKQKTQQAEKVERVAQKNLHSPVSTLAPSSRHSISKVEISPGKITAGQGEYIVFHSTSEGSPREVSEQTFDKVFPILIDHSPGVIAKQKSADVAQEIAGRYEQLKAKIKEIDPTLEIAFIPKTLYELAFLRRCIKNDVKHGKISHSATSQDLYYHKEDVEKDLKERKKCWFLCFFEDQGDSAAPEVKALAYRLNKSLVKKFSPTAAGFTHQELKEHAEKEIEFLKKHYQDFSPRLEDKTSLLYSVRERNHAKSIDKVCNKGPAVNFGYELDYAGTIRSMGIRDEEDAHIVRNALALDCSRIAQTAFVLYRGGDFKKDVPYKQDVLDKTEKAHSLSYGTSLFAGSLYDADAAAFHYMRKLKNDGYALAVPCDQVEHSPFFIPTTHTIAQLSARGDTFHARTKIWKEFTSLKNAGGITLYCSEEEKEFLRSNLSRGELLESFESYKKEAILLKKSQAEGKKKK